MADEKVETFRYLNKRVFVNNVDTYASKYVAKFLHSCVVGASLSDDTELEMEEEENKLSPHDEPAKVKGTFQIVGTLADKTGEKSSFTTEEYRHLKREELLQHLIECDVIIYNITECADQIEEATWAVTALHDKLNSFPSPKMFILISTIMTWAMSKPSDPDDPMIPLTEENYRRRRPHPNFKDHISLEKLVVKLGKTKTSQFSTYVVASGLQYGMGEHVFHYFFKVTWSGMVPRLPVFGDGANIIPTIHINDLAGVVQNVIDQKPNLHYLLATDDSKNTLEDIIWAIAVALGPGKTQNVSKEDTFLTQELTQTDIDSLFVNLRFEAAFLKDNFNIHWVSETGIVENIQQVVEEFRHTRGLLPIRIFIHGPPAVGKSTIADKLCKHYRLHHVKLKETITETLDHLESVVRMGGGEKGGEDFSGAQEFLETLKENMEQNGGQLEDLYVTRIIRDKLMSKPCSNQGYILDGFPKTYEQAKDLFYEDGDDSDPDSKKIIPEFVISLDASNELLKERVLNLPESLVEGTSYSQERFLRRLNRFRASNVEDETVLNFFDELEIHPEHIEITSSDDAEYLLVTEKVIQIVGKPRNYGPSTEELEAEERRQADCRLRLQAAEKAEAEHKEAMEAEQRAARWEQWSQRLEEVKSLEKELLEAQSVLIREYLMTSVMPVLAQGLIECCRIRPDDPVDFLAEFLFKSSPQFE
ncbi:adenylate kinase 7 isoform X2 [Chanos chanos]|uniref:Adenylate kinase 7 isoform X2 n=1 Tax=Chanos chanos TaxID=29144 RepID=A0A6J2W4F5_CHACN|nr:adenylate kinase 7 isoform X2 [Chanos chanos]